MSTIILNHNTKYFKNKYERILKKIRELYLKIDTIGI